MPVDFIIILIPLAVLVSLFVASISKQARKYALTLTMIFVLTFVCIYFTPGWVLGIKARNGDAEAQYKLGEYYWTRLGYNWSDIEARDKWWVEAANQGHPHAMYQLGFFSMFGTSKYIPKDLDAARIWLEAAYAAGDYDAPSGLKSLAEIEIKESGR